MVVRRHLDSDSELSLPAQNGMLITLEEKYSDFALKVTSR